MGLSLRPIEKRWDLLTLFLVKRSFKYRRFNYQQINDLRFEILLHKVYPSPTFVVTCTQHKLTSSRFVNSYEVTRQQESDRLGNKPTNYKNTSSFPESMSTEDKKFWLYRIPFVTRLLLPVDHMMSKHVHKKFVELISH